MENRPPYASRMAFILTKVCNIRCRHCISECDTAQEETLAWPVLERTIQAAAATGIVRVISFTGGEPFLRMGTLAPAVALCASLGLESTVTTNGFWAVSVETAKKVLGRLAGLTRLGLSTDRFHQEFIDVARIRNAILAAHELGIHCAIRVSYLNDPDAELEGVRQQLIEAAGLYELEGQPVQPAGRAEREVDGNLIFLYDATRAVCRNIDCPVVEVDGVATACCGLTSRWKGNHPLRLGSVEEHSIGDMLGRADRDPVIHGLRLWGPVGLLRLVEPQAEREGVSFSPPAMTEMCSVCEYLLADPGRAGVVKRALQDTAVQREIALARLVELGEPSMFAALEGNSDGSVRGPKARAT